MANYPNLDEKIRINIFCAPKTKNSKVGPIKQCNHVGTFNFDGFNEESSKVNHRVMCSKCGKRFGNDVNTYNLLFYQQKLKKIVYQLFLLKTNQKSIAVRKGVAHEMLSRFKKNLVEQTYEQNKDLIESSLKSLPRGIILGDETFMGKRGHSDVEVLFINENYETLSTGPVKNSQKNRAIQDTFNKIPQECSKKLKILMSDGEVGYKQIPKMIGGKVIHLIQYHNKKQLGQVSIEKYRKVGPHRFHYIIKTHWKAFSKGTHVHRFRWEIKFIRGQIQAKRGRPKKTSQTSKPKKPKLKWQIEVDNFYNGKMQISGSSEVYINHKTEIVSPHKDSKKWMIQILQPLFKIFKGRVMTTALIESKNNQIKGMSGDRKQQDPDYNHKLFALSSFIVEFGFFPLVNLNGRPLFKYLMKDIEKVRLKYIRYQKDKKIIQTTLPIH
jgi:hypothetical protein